MDNITTVKLLVKDAEDYADSMAPDRIRAMEYYRGEMKDTPSDVGRSEVVSRDVRAHVKKVLPSVMRTVFGGAELGEFLPVGAGDEDGAEQATDYINRVVAPETDAEQVLYDAAHDALLLRNGIVKWWWDERQEVAFSRHTGLPDDALAVLIGDDSVDVLEHSSYEEQTDQGVVSLHDVKIRRVRWNRQVKLAAVPRENFLIHPDATNIEDSLIVGDVTQIRRGDLISMGYDAELAASIPVSNDDDLEKSTRRDMVTSGDEPDPASEAIDYYDLFVRVDSDGDGIAELRHMVFAGTISELGLLVDEECDDVQFADVTAMRQPHQWEGISIFDDVADIAKIKTTLLRQTLDNIYWQNNPQPVVQSGAIENLDAVFNPEFGLPIRVKQGFDARNAYSINQIPFVAGNSFAMIDYMDKEAQDRTGISDASAGLAPDALQNMTAKASAMIEQSGIGQTEFMVRNIAKGVRTVFKGLLRLIIRHQDVPRTVRLRNEWVSFDPRQWNADMDYSVNTGLGAGTRERDMQVLQVVLGLQEKMLTTMGADNPFVKPENLWNSLSRLVEAAGLKTPEMYFTEPDLEEVAQKMAQAGQAGQAGEMAKAQNEQAKIQMDQQKAQAELQIEREKMAAEMQLARERMEAEFSLAREKMAMEASLSRNVSDSNGLGTGIRMGGKIG